MSDSEQKVCTFLFLEPEAQKNCPNQLKKVVGGIAIGMSALSVSGENSGDTALVF